MRLLPFLTLGLFALAVACGEGRIGTSESGAHRSAERPRGWQRCEQPG